MCNKLQTEINRTVYLMHTILLSISHKHFADDFPFVIHPFLRLETIFIDDLHILFDFDEVISSILSKSGNKCHSVSMILKKYHGVELILCAFTLAPSLPVEWI